VKFRTKHDENYKSSVFFTPVGEMDEDYQVQQNMAAECDVNTIMARYQKGQEITHIAQVAAQYGDFSEVADYKTGLERILEADALFMELPSSIRDRFMNDPAAFIEFATDKANEDELRKMGLAPPPQAPPEPQLVKVVNEVDDEKSSAQTKPAKGDQ